SGLAGSAGALVWSPNALTLGAAGAVWGVIGAALILEARRIYVFGGQAVGVVVVNPPPPFFIPPISIGGHLGGFVRGALCALAFSGLRRQPAVATLAMGAVGLLSVVVAVQAVA